MSEGRDLHARARERLRALWDQYRPSVMARLDVLERAAQAAEEGVLDETLRGRAADEAHKLAGVLGTFGHPHGTELARRAESLLTDDAPRQDAGLAGIVRALRVELDAESGGRMG